MSADITLTDAITALVAEKRAVGLQIRRRGAGAGPVRGVLPPASSPGWQAPTQASVEAWIAAARRRGVTPATLQRLGRAGPGAGPLAGPPGRGGLRPARRGAAPPRPLRPAHLHRPGTGGPVRPDRPLPLLLAGSVPAPGHAGAVPHDLRLRPACSEARLLRCRRRRPRRRRAADPRRARAAKTGRSRLSAALRDRLAGYHAQVAGRRPAGTGSSPAPAGQPADARQRRQELPPVPVAGPHPPRRPGPRPPRPRSATHLCGQQPAVVVRPAARTSARCCRSCRPTWATPPSPTPTTTCG